MFMPDTFKYGAERESHNRLNEGCQLWFVKTRTTAFEKFSKDQIENRFSSAKFYEMGEDEFKMITLRWGRVFLPLEVGTQAV